LPLVLVEGAVAFSTTMGGVVEVARCFNLDLVREAADDVTSASNCEKGESETNLGWRRLGKNEEQR